MRRTDLNWQAMSARVALLVYNKQFAKDCRQAAFVVDDTLKKRRGKKVQGACYHFDHNEKRSVFSQQFVQLGLTGIFQLKRNSTKYRFQGRDYTLSELYVLVKRKMKRSAKGRYRTYALTVELSLPVKEKQNPRTALKLVFSSDVRNHNENWVVFVCTDTQLSAEEVLLAYSKWLGCGGLLQRTQTKSWIPQRAEWSFYRLLCLFKSQCDTLYAPVKSDA